MSGHVAIVCVVVLLAAPQAQQATSPSPAEAVSRARVPAQFATVIPSGSVAGTYTAAHSPILIRGNVIVPADTSLVFEAGCKVYIGGSNTCIAVFGTIEAHGTAQAPVEFVSARTEPNPWDWDRIYCRSRKQSRLRHCIVRHANYGVFVENGSIEIAHCLFEKNSLHAVTVKNARVRMAHTEMRGGHVSALMCRAGAVVHAESLVVRDNIVGIACENDAYVRLTGGTVSRNTKGVLISPRSDVSFVKTSVTANRHGVISVQDIPAAQAQMVYKNGTDILQVDTAALRTHLTPPQRVASISIPSSRQEVLTPDDFTPGFSATTQQRRTQTSYMGNVTVGMEYFDPQSFSQQIEAVTYDDSTGAPRYYFKDTLIEQTRYIGEHGGSVVDQVQPSLQVFANGRSGDANVNLMADVYGNSWLDRQGNMRARNLRLSFDYGDHKIYAGDYMLSEDELTFFGTSVTGLRYRGAYGEMGKGHKRFRLDCGAGETVVAKDSGQHDADLINTVIDSGMSQRQQMSYYGMLAYKPHYDVTLSGGAVIARDQAFNPIIRAEVHDPGAPEPIEAQTVFAGADVSLWQDRISMGTRMAVGGHDTLYRGRDTNAVQTDDQEEISRINWYNPEIGDALSSVGRNLQEGAHMGITGYIETGLGGYMVAAQGMYLMPRYFSAGNTYLEADRREVALSVGKDIGEAVTLGGEYAYEKRFASQVLTVQSDSQQAAPQHLHTLTLDGRVVPGEHLPVFSADYRTTYDIQQELEDSTAYYDRVSDVPSGITPQEVIDTTTNDTIWMARVPVQVHTRVVTQRLGIGVKQRFANGLAYDLQYKLVWDNEFGVHPDPAQDNLEDRLRNTVQARLRMRMSPRVQHTLRASVTPYTETRDTVRGIGYQVSDRFKVYIVPRILSVQLQGELSHTHEKRNAEYLDTRISVDARRYLLKAMVSHSISKYVSWDLSVGYEYSEDETDYSPQNYRVMLGQLRVSYLF
jgi:hypothetical protein